MIAGHRFLALCLGLAVALPPLSADAAPQIVAPTGTPVELGVNQGVIMRLDRPAANVFVADPAVADIKLKSPTTLYVLGKAGGSTTLFAVDQQDHVLVNSRIEVHQDVAALQQALTEMVPDSKVDVRSFQNSIVLSGPVTSAAQAADISRITASFVPDKNHVINNLQIVAPNQVNLRVRIAEVSRDVEKQLGVNWDALETVGGAAASGASFPLGLITAGPPAIGSGTNSLSLGYQSGPNKTASIDGVVQALEQHDLLTMLAEPNLTAVSGQKASFLAGGEFPVPVPQSGGSGSAPVITIDYKQFGVSLNFTPTILAHNRISLHVAPEVSQLSTQNEINYDGFTVPSLTTRRAETTVELGSGQSFVIGGLLQNSTTQDLAKFPWLGDVPVLGALFRSTQFQRNEAELVIIVTPYIVKPISSGAFAAPTDGFVPPTDFDRVLRGAINRVNEPPALITSAPAPAYARSASVPPAAVMRSVPVGDMVAAPVAAVASEPLRPIPVTPASGRMDVAPTALAPSGNGFGLGGAPWATTGSMPPPNPASALPPAQLRAAAVLPPGLAPLPESAPRAPVGPVGFEID